MELLLIRSQHLADVLSNLGENEEGCLLELGGIGGDALKHEGQELRPSVIREDAVGELGDGVAQLFGDGFAVLALN